MMTTTVIYFIYKFSNEEEDGQKEIADFVMVGVMAICQIGSDLYFRRISGRIATVMSFACI